MKTINGPKEKKYLPPNQGSTVIPPNNVHLAGHAVISLAKRIHLEAEHLDVNKKFD